MTDPDRPGPTSHWEASGFSSEEEFFASFKAEQERLERLWFGPRRTPPAGRLPGDEVAGVERPRRRTRRQVGIRLTADEYARLVEAARFYGAAPGTMARLLVNRGVRAALEGQAAED
jgi:hypothetical protein